MINVGCVTSNNRIPNTATTPVAATDNESKKLQNELTNAKQRLNQLSADPEMAAEERAKERLELQKKIAELNRQLRLQRMEQEKETKKASKEQEKKEIIREENLKDLNSPRKSEALLPEKEKEEAQKISISPVDIQSFFSADFALQKERILEVTAHQKEGTKNILEAEIKQDTLFGNDTSAKREQLSSLKREQDFLIEERQDTPMQAPFHKDSNTKIIIKER